jgi:hypothetical protein
LISCQSGGSAVRKVSVLEPAVNSRNEEEHQQMDNFFDHKNLVLRARFFYVLSGMADYARKEKIQP